MIILPSENTLKYNAQEKYTIEFRISKQISLQYV
jgi:hypothetical protein